ncbi:hypothetical protein [Comamonas testosteroni]|uniref:hypothetical protein n=1 Tax=Comamonas testosteroni TaxID=285 RepID=UPI0026F0CCF8|nr:hypothetical protein [Comamonas testosteroni]
MSTGRGLGNNAAGRLHIFFTELRNSLSSIKEAQKAWAQTLKLSSEKQSVVGYRIAEAIVACDRELTLITAALRDSNYAENLTEPYFQTLRNVLSLNLLQSQSSQTNQYLREEVLLSLRWASVVLPDEDHQATAESMAELQALVAELEAALQSQGIPPHFKQYARGLLDSLRSAMSMWPIQGEAPLRNAVRKAVADAQFEEDVLKAELAEMGGHPEVETLREKIGSAIKKAATMTGDIEKLSKGYGYLLEKGRDFGQVIADGISSLGQ